MQKFIHVQSVAEETPFGAKRYRVDRMEMEDGTATFEYQMWLVTGNRTSTTLYAISGGLPFCEYPNKEEELLSSLWTCLKKLAKVGE